MVGRCNSFCDGLFLGATVDERNPAPVDKYFIPLFTGFYTSQDFFHQPYLTFREGIIFTIELTKNPAATDSCWRYSAVCLQAESGMPRIDIQHGDDLMDSLRWSFGTGKNKRAWSLEDGDDGDGDDISSIVMMLSILTLVIW